MDIYDALAESLTDRVKAGEYDLELKRILRRDYTDKKYASKLSPLIAAGSWGMMELLFERGGDISEIRHDGSNLLSRHVYHLTDYHADDRLMDILSGLIRAGLDPGWKDADGNAALGGAEAWLNRNWKSAENHPKAELYKKVKSLLDAESGSVRGGLCHERRRRTAELTAAIRSGSLPDTTREVCNYVDFDGIFPIFELLSTGDRLEDLRKLLDAGASTCVVANQMNVFQYATAFSRTESAQHLRQFFQTDERVEDALVVGEYDLFITLAEHQQENDRLIGDAGVYKTACGAYHLHVSRDTPEEVMGRLVGDSLRLSYSDTADAYELHTSKVGKRRSAAGEGKSIKRVIKKIIEFTGGTVSVEMMAEALAGYWEMRES